MRLIDADEVRRVIEGRRGYGSTKWEDGFISGKTMTLREIKYAPTVDVPQPLTRDGVLAAVKAIEDAGGKAVVEWQAPSNGRWYGTRLRNWSNPDVPRWNVRVRAVEVETEDVPLTQLVGRTIKGEDVGLVAPPTYLDSTRTWMWWNGVKWRPFPDGTLDLATGLVTVVKGEA